MTTDQLHHVQGHDPSETIGSFLTRLHDLIANAQTAVEKLVGKEQCRLWIVVVAGNDPDADVAGLTRGRFAAIDTERLMTSTEANIVKELKGYPDRIGVLGSVLDAKILHLPVLSALALSRAFASEALKLRMKAAGLTLKPDAQKDALERFGQTELASIFQAGPQGTMRTGKKIGSNSLQAFQKLAEIASTNDSALNTCIGRALESAGLILSFEIEKDFGSGLTRRTDIIASTLDRGTIRIEVMWRAKTGRAEIANYTLQKLANYGKAIGFLKSVEA